MSFFLVRHAEGLPDFCVVWGGVGEGELVIVAGFIFRKLIVRTNFL